MCVFLAGYFEEKKNHWSSILDLYFESEVLGCMSIMKCWGVFQKRSVGVYEYCEVLECWGV